MSKIRVLIVDDSPTMRVLLANTLRRDGDIEVVGAVGDPYEAREAIKRLDPDVLTLDIEMPHMNGIEFLEKIMRLRPMPVIMVSTLTQAGADATLHALELGAFDCVGKPTAATAVGGFSELPAKVRAAAQSNIRPLGPTTTHTPHAGFTPSGRVVAIGSSTGGVEALVTVLKSMPANCPPTVITQHMPATFTKSFAERLNRLCAPEILEADDGVRLQAGRVVLAPGGERHLELSGTTDYPRCRLVEGEAVSGHRPSVDVLFNSVAKVCGANAVGVILTGMGRDGAQGLLTLRNAGAHTIGQDEASCVVYGMPKAAAELGAVERQLPLSRIANQILNFSGELQKDCA
jgi:two-component system chemotaxis response regulator CheB